MCWIFSCSEDDNVLDRRSEYYRGHTMTQTHLNVVILAAGQGKRMHSALPKVLHTIANVSLLERVVNTALTLNPQKIIVICGHEREVVQSTLSHLPVQWVVQEAQLGTGHAALQAMPHLHNDSKTLILFGDGPLIASDSLQAVIHSTPKSGMALLVAEFADPRGLGRVVRDNNGLFLRIVEEKDARAEELHLNEIFTGILCAPTTQMTQWLQRLSNDNAQGEYYLTELPALALADGCAVTTVRLQHPQQAQGINDKKQLAQQERYFQSCQAEALLLQGLILRDPNRFDLRGVVEFGMDVVIDINVILEGKVQMGDRVQIGANTVIRNCIIGDDVIVKENCILEDSVIGNDCTVGPFARLRPGTVLKEKAGIGNFVEVKKSTIGSASKVNHLTYIGDATIGDDVNIGAGTITCNYDGVNKHQTIIGDRAFIGSDTQLVAPVTVGEGATIGAGSTITKDVPANQLSFCRKQQIFIENWERPQKEE